MQRVVGLLGLLRLPQLVDQQIRGNDAIGIQQQHSEQRSLLRAAELERATLLDRIERAENAELDRCRRPATLAPGWPGVGVSEPI